MNSTRNPENIPPVSCKRWKSMIYKNWELLCECLTSTICELMELASTMEIQAVSMHIIYLRTSVCNHQPYYRIYLFDHQAYNGNTRCWVNWQMPVFADYINRMFPIEGNPLLQGYKPRIEIMEQKRRKSAEQFHLVMKELILRMVSDVGSQLTQGIEYPIYFGEYMKPQQLVFNREKIL